MIIFKAKCHILLYYFFYPNQSEDFLRFMVKWNIIRCVFAIVAILFVTIEMDHVSWIYIAYGDVATRAFVAQLRYGPNAWYCRSTLWSFWSFPRRLLARLAWSMIVTSLWRKRWVRKVAASRVFRMLFARSGRTPTQYKDLRMRRLNFTRSSKEKPVQRAYWPQYVIYWRG